MMLVPMFAARNWATWKSDLIGFTLSDEPLTEPIAWQL